MPRGDLSTVRVFLLRCFCLFVLFGGPRHHVRQHLTSHPKVQRSTWVLWICLFGGLLMTSIPISRYFKRHFILYLSTSGQFLDIYSQLEVMPKSATAQRHCSWGGTMNFSNCITTKLRVHRFIQWLTLVSNGWVTSEAPRTATGGRVISKISLVTWFVPVGVLITFNNIS